MPAGKPQPKSFAKSTAIKLRRQLRLTPLQKPF
jgi:hypothetical protein